MVKLTSVAVTLVLGGLTAFAQLPPKPESSSPFYQVLVVGRTIQAVNYGNISGPTKIDFKGTVLQQQAKGSADVVPKRGVTEVNAKFEGLTPPARFGTEYLTYVLWAISPEGRTLNLGEIIPDSSDHAHVRVSVPLQAFALVVTAEPYYSVSRPSNVVVLENAVRRDTKGKVEEIQARYQPAPQAPYSFDPSAAPAAPYSAKKVSQSRYQVMLALYEAQNAIQIAVSQGASQYATDILARAQALLRQAQYYDSAGADSGQIIMIAREAAEAAEDARVVTRRQLPTQAQASQIPPPPDEAIH